ncbi:unnamed protein product [Blepharisma stoltei]|uniref:Mitochondrial carrier protein n=1 Tax=Blepharisma stoltei TaxID=1481888 RepID=A0AAU9IJZ0_9CILI|nr:unnamed protein product [Blepharisma stoltei]
MDELVYQKLQENERRMKLYGPHLAGLINASINLCVYPFLQISTQLQLSPIPSSHNYIGKSYAEKVSSFIWNPHPANRPYKAPLFKNANSAIIWNSLQGYLGFYRGFFMGISHFYFGILARTAGTYLTFACFGENYIKSSQERIITETLLSSMCEAIIQPIFVAQTRFIQQNRRANFRTYDDFFHMWKISGFRSMYQGWGAILPKQAIINVWVNHAPMIDDMTDEILGLKRNNKYNVFSKEILLGLAPYFIAYPFLTAQRRVACQESHIGMPERKYKGVLHCMWKVATQEGIDVLFRGSLFYSIAIAAWVFAMPTLTQTVWQKYEDSAKEDISRLLRLD